MRLSGKRFKIIAEHRQGRRVSLRFRMPTRPYQINFTVSRYIPAEHIKGVS